MRFHSILTIVIVYLLTVGQSKGQTQFHETNKIIPPSPTAASLGKYGSIPVSMYNGTPNITVPLYDVTTASNALKIFMQYDASGTRVQQDASWVGLGWSLISGGVISRTVKQIDDFKSSGYFYSGPLPATSSSNWTTYTQDIYYGNVDAEQDVFNFNFNGYSGRFVLGKKADGAQVYQDEKSNLKIQYLDTQGKWLITTPEGYIYTFGVPESALSYSLNGLSEFTNIDGVNGLTPDYGNQPVTSWYLSSITSPNNDVITFQYVNGKSLSLLNKSEAYSQLIQLEVYSCSSNTLPNLGSAQHVYTASRQELTDVYLKKIIFKGGTIDFNTTSRDDIEPSSTVGSLLPPSKLDNIVIKKTDGTILKKYVFSYSYFDSSAGYSSKRLKLDNITEYSANNIPKPPFAFVYNNPNGLPDKYSKSMDNWGFYNNKTNYTLLPSTTFPLAQNSFVGADREPDTTVVYPAYGVLKELYYPTGGKTVFDYELHDYSGLTGSQKYIYKPKYCEVRANSNNPNYNVETNTFVVMPDPEDDPTYPFMKIPVEIRCNYQKVDANISNIGIAYSNMRRLNPDGTTTSMYGCSSTWDQDSGSSSNYYNLLPGTYQLELLATNGWSYQMSASWNEKTLITNRKGGGIRVQRITDYDASGKTEVRKFIYRGDDGKSSGIMITNPEYFGTWQMNYALNSCSLGANFGIILSSSLFTPGLMSSSGIVGYTKVTELIGENGENGKTEHYFYNTPNSTPGSMLQPLVGSTFNGKEVSTKYFDVQNTLIKQKTYQYSIGETTTIQDIKVYTDANLQQSSQSNPVQGYGYIALPYTNISRWTIPVSETETTLSGTVPVSTIKYYTYGNQQHRMPTQIIVTGSNGKELKQNFSYPHEMVAKGINPNNVYSNMITGNMVSPAIETVQSINGTQTEKAVVNYGNIGSGLLPDKISSEYQKGTYSSQTLIRYDYTSSGNIRAVQNLEGAKTIYLWGYNDVYPIAEIKNATYQDVVNVLGQNNIDVLAGANPGSDAQVMTLLSVLRTDSRLKKAMVTTFTYNPLVGVTSMTDPKGMTVRYEYDNYQRLIRTLDAQGNIIKEYKYHYQNQ